MKKIMYALSLSCAMLSLNTADAVNAMQLNNRIIDEGKVGSKSNPIIIDDEGLQNPIIIPDDDGNLQNNSTTSGIPLQQNGIWAHIKAWIKKPVVITGALFAVGATIAGVCYWHWNAEADNEVRTNFYGGYDPIDCMNRAFAFCDNCTLGYVCRMLVNEFSCANISGWFPCWK